MSVPCSFCGGPCNPHDEGTHHEVSGWVHGKKKDGLTLRVDTGKVAHEKCILKAKAGQPSDQADLFGEDKVRKNPHEAQETDMSLYAIDVILSEGDEVEKSSGKSIQELLDNSSLGTPEAKALIATVSDEDAARVIARSKEIEGEVPF